MIKQIKELSHENLMVQVNKKIAAIYKQKSNKDDTN